MQLNLAYNVQSVSRMSLVSLVKLEEPEVSLDRAINNAIDLTQFKFSKSTKNIVIKPNLCYYWDYSTGHTTDPKFVGTLIDVIRSKTSPTVKIAIVESDASAMKCKYVFPMLGYEKLAKEKSVELVNLTQDKATKTSVNVNNNSHEFLVPQTIAEADVLINVPKIRYMPGVKISCALKNIYGCNPYPKKFKYHPWLDEAIVCLNKIMRPDLCLLDAIIVKGVQTLKLGLVIASTDPVALDAAASRIAGINPKSVGHIVLASKEAIGNLQFTTKGEKLDYFKNQFPERKTKHKVKEHLAKIYSRFFQ